MMAGVQERTLLLCSLVLLLLTFQHSTATTTIANSHSGDSVLLRYLEKSDQDAPIADTNNDGGDKTKAEIDDRVMVCGNEEPSHSHNGRQKRFKVAKFPDGRVNKWEVHRLTWAVVEPSKQMHISKQRRIIGESLQVWSNVSPMQFEMVNDNSNPDISFKFARRRHGPSWDPVFDGKTLPNTPNVYGHAWGPGNDRTGIAGDVHVDEDDDWTDDNKLKGILVHELGHSMGLSHSQDPSAIMFAVYRDTTELADDDIRGIQSLYGSRSRPIPVTSRPRPRPRPTYRPRIRPQPVTLRPPRTRRPGGIDRPYVTPKTTTKVPPTFAPNSACETKTINAVIENPFSDEPGMYLVFMEERVHSVMYDGTHLTSTSIKGLFKGAPNNPDVVFAVKETKSILFLKDNKSWEFKKSGLTEDSPKSLDHTHFPEKPSYVITLFDPEGYKRRFLFGKRYWWSFYYESPKVEPHYEIPRFSQYLPSDVMFATTWADNQLYIVSKDSYIILDTAHRSMTHKRPFKGKPEWLHPLCLSGVSPLVAQPSVLVTCLIALVMGCWTSRR